MVDTEKRKGGGKLARSETVTVRLDPKLRYLAELAARKQRRSLSSYIEWAIEDSLSRTILDTGGDRSLGDEANALWDVDDADRFVRLAFRYPDLLTHEEQIRWKLIRESGIVWRGNYRGTPVKWRWDVAEGDLIYDRLRKYWPIYCAVADGTSERDALPTWSDIPPPAAKPAKTGFDAMDDDIPF